MCSFGWSVEAGEDVCVERIVAIVNDNCIALSELNEALEPYVKRIREADYSPEVESEMLFKVRKDVLNKIIDQELAKQESKKLKVRVSEEEVDKQLEQIKSQHFLTDEELRESLVKEGYTFEEYRKRIKEQMLQTKLINIEIKSKVAITDKDIRDYYEAHKADYQGDRKYHLRTVLVKVPPTASEDQKKAAVEKIEEIAEALQSGTDFDEVAYQSSEDAPVVTGGDLGQLALDELSNEFRETVASMAAGQTSPVIKTPGGYQILLLQEIIEMPGKTLKEVSIEIHEELYRDFVEEKYKVWLKELRERSFVKIIL
jgi:peptidyl-prolyl cis-trans isomerase SurA